MAKPPRIPLQQMDAVHQLRVRVAPDLRRFMESEGGQEFLRHYIDGIDHDKNVLLTCHPEQMQEIRGRITGRRVFIFEVEKCLEAHRQHLEKTTGQDQTDLAKNDEERVRRYLSENPERRPAGL